MYQPDCRLRVGSRQHVTHTAPGSSKASAWYVYDLLGIMPSIHKQCSSIWHVMSRLVGWQSCIHDMLIEDLRAET